MFDSDLVNLKGIDALYALQWFNVSNNDLKTVLVEIFFYLSEVNLNNNDLSNEAEVTNSALPYLAQIDISSNDF